MSPNPPLRRRPALLLGRLLLASLPVATVVWVHAAAASAERPGLEAAIAAQQERVAQQPGSAEAFNDLGNLLVLRPDLAAAEAAYREALRLDADSIGALFNLGVLLRSDRRPAEAIEVFERALELDPAQAWAQYQLGAAHQDLGHRKQATRAYARAFALDHRLALPDVNPLVIGNPLVTAAMLLPRDDVPVTDTTPRSYADPARITQLLLPPAAPAPAPSGEPSGDAAGAQPDATQPPTSSSAPGTLVPPTTWTSGAEAEGDDQQASPPPAQGAEETTPPERRRITADDLRTLRILNQPAPAPGAAPPPSGGTRNQPGAVAPQRFRPGTRSSAQLDLRLIPGGDRAGDPVAVTRISRARR